MEWVKDLSALNPADEHYAARFVDLLLRAAVAAGASDVHIHPVHEGLELRWRLDGVMGTVGRFPRGRVSDVVARLKVLAGLLTYRTEVPQEGRIRWDRYGSPPASRSSPPGQAVSTSGSTADVPVWPEMRVSTFPTVMGERAVVRFFPQEHRWQRVGQLGFPAHLEQRLAEVLSSTMGILVVSGPAGSGKTTTAYACLSEIAACAEGTKNLVTLEDPVEVLLPGVSQSQVAPESGFDFAAGVRSLMRQDPDVILIGEIRDQATTEAAFGAALTGHLVLTTFHAGNSVEVVTRLRDMGVESYVLRSTLRGIICQRLLRVLCACARTTGEVLDVPQPKPASVRIPQGCADCHYSGYRGRRVIAEWLDVQDPKIRPLIDGHLDERVIADAARATGWQALWDEAWQAVRCGWTSPQEVRRVLGWKASPAAREPQTADDVPISTPHRRIVG